MRGKRWMLAGVAALLLCGAAMPARGEGTVYIRVVGRDDTAAGQAEKLRVRDAVLPLCPESPEALLGALPLIAREAGAACRVELRPWRPDPAMDWAPTLYITVGEGRGHNWWGVLYGDSLAMARAEEGDAGGPVEFVWPVWAWLRALLGW